MYLSRIALSNWRSYDQAVFEFRKPSRKERKPIVLIGAMNGHGKTSFLLSLYLGLFGRHGLRYCEGFRVGGDGDAAGYRRAIESYRRNGADPSEPTEIDLTFAISDRDSPRQKEVQIIRQWFFTSSNKLRQGDSFEEVRLLVDGKLVKSAELDSAHMKIEQSLFPAHVTPAFFFDGEQAQSLIEKMGEEGLRKAVEVMFGMKVVTELKDTLRNYLNSAHSKAGGRGRSSSVQDKLDEKKRERESVNDLMGKRQRDLVTIRAEHEAMGRERSQKMEDLARFGGAVTKDVGELQRQYGQAEKQRDQSEKALSTALSSMGLNLALVRLAPAVRNRLAAEAERESWENLRTGTLAKKEEVLSVALPEPSREDPLLGALSDEVRSKFRTRLLSALDRIYNPPPDNCATEYLLGHIRGEQRSRVLQQLDQVTRSGGESIRQLAQQAKSARESMEDSKRKLERISNLPEDVKLLKERIEELNDLIGTAGNRIGQLDNEINSLKGQLHDLNAEIGRLQEELARLEPEQARLAVAERVNRVIEALSDELAPTTASRIEKLVTKHFLSIADSRFQGGKIELRPNEAPVIRFPGDRPASLLEVMSGFESRSFGIAFSLALAEITRQRIPLVIDTPLGNADSEYRPRTLAALRQFDLDQIIILTHDEEVTPRLLAEIEPFVNQTFLVKFDSKEKRSKVIADKFFGDDR
jgi:DNA sulfur modification protein DndD